MKNLVVTVIIAVAVMASFSVAKAQYAIPSYNVPVFVNSTFQDGNSWTLHNDNSTREERKLKVRVNTDKSSENPWVYISVYKIGTHLQSIPFLVEAGSEFSISIGNGQWGVTVISASDNCYLSVWEE